MDAERQKPSHEQSNDQRFRTTRARQQRLICHHIMKRRQNLTSAACTNHLPVHQIQCRSVPTKMVAVQSDTRRHTLRNTRSLRVVPVGYRDSPDYRAAPLLAPKQKHPSFGQPVPRACQATQSYGALRQYPRLPTSSERRRVEGPREAWAHVESYSQPLKDHRQGRSLLAPPSHQTARVCWG